MRTWTGILLLLFAALVHAAEPELLEPEKAFRFSARLKDARSIEVTYQIAEGYYLYRKQFKFAIAPGEAKLGEPQLPQGKMKRDDFFGDVETYRGMLSIILPLEVAEPGPAAVTLVATSQGCADVGVCYIPQDQKAQLQLAAAGSPAAGVFVMGVLSALIAGPCVAAPLAGALLYISQSRDVVLGGSALFALALGMGAPLLVVGASAGALLPRAGAWMETVKRFFGVVLLGLAIYIVSPLLPAPAHMGAWAVLLIVTAVFLRAIDPLPPQARPFDRFSKGVGVLALVLGIAFAIGALSGGRDLLQPLAGLRGGAGAAEARETPFQRIGSLPELDARIAAAGKPVMLDFYADWCVSCKEMERFTFTDERVRQRFNGLVLLQADVTANSSDHAALLKRFRLFGPPGIVFFDPHGNEIEGLRVIGFQPADKFAAVLDEVLRSRRTALQ